MEDDNETWILDAGDEVIQKRAAQGPAALQPLERLIYCLWVADYGMRNAGDLSAAGDLYPDFQAEAAELAGDLKLPTTHAAFALPPAELEQRYLQLFDAICEEIRAKQA
ncbi:MAG: hypothetical protein QNJ30_19200 [Kiloniellales bacterium]|nr:hypothetical protein [Kiloniellales bacterium]